MRTMLPRLPVRLRRQTHELVVPFGSVPASVVLDRDRGRRSAPPNRPRYPPGSCQAHRALVRVECDPGRGDDRARAAVYWLVATHLRGDASSTEWPVQRSNPFNGVASATEWPA